MDRTPGYDECRGIFEDAGPAGRIVRNGKYGRWPEAIAFLARQVVNHIPPSFAVDPPCLIIPIPLHRTRLHQRGFSTPAILAKALSCALNVHFDTRGLVRVKKTRSQASLTLKERYSNVRGAFRGRLGLVGADILLVDDVYTTGATLNEASRTLKKVGASRVRALCASYVDENRANMP